MFLGARRRANPYERIGKGIFINRAAVKMANLDALCGLLHPRTEPVRAHGTPAGGWSVRPRSLIARSRPPPPPPPPLQNPTPYYFADACAGPGGFTGTETATPRARTAVVLLYQCAPLASPGSPEYVLWRQQQHKVPTQGFGFTLRVRCALP